MPGTGGSICKDPGRMTGMSEEQTGGHGFSNAEVADDLDDSKTLNRENSRQLEGKNWRLFLSNSLEEEIK